MSGKNEAMRQEAQIKRLTRREKLTMIPGGVGVAVIIIGLVLLTR